jgi:hypothetical protein
LTSSPLKAYEVTTMIGNRPQRRIGLNTAGRLITIEQRKLNIHQDEVRPFGHGCPYALLAIFGFNYRAAFSCPCCQQAIELFRVGR